MSNMVDHGRGEAQCRSNQGKILRDVTRSVVREMECSASHNGRLTGSKPELKKEAEEALSVSGNESESRETPSPAKRLKLGGGRLSRTILSHQFSNKETSGMPLKGNNPRRYRLCRRCPGCLTPDCGRCDSCRLFEQHKERIVLGKSTCDEIICQEPIALFNSPMGSTRDEEDGCCPFRFINKELFDLRCIFCRVLPRVGFANKSELYRHYSVSHFHTELRRDFGYQSECPVCQKSTKSSNFISHIGQVHRQVERYLPDYAKIPDSVKGRSGQRYTRNRRRLETKLEAVVVRRDDLEDLEEVWPEPPEGFNPATREILEEEEEEPEIYQDGFLIESVWDEEEPLFVSREEDVVMPDYSGARARCCICGISSFQDILESVRHVQEDHGVLGCSQIIMLAADRMLKSGYICLTG